MEACGTYQRPGIKETSQDDINLQRDVYTLDVFVANIMAGLVTALRSLLSSHPQYSSTN